MKQKMDSIVLSNLYLHAVLPALSELTLFDKKARAMIASANFTLSIGVINQLPIVLHIHQGNVIFHAEYQQKTDIKLLFLTHKHLNHFFSGKTKLPPLVMKGFWRVVSLRKFARLAAHLNTILEDKTSTEQMFTRLVFLIAGLSLKPLAQYDVIAQAVLRKTPHGLAEFSIGDESIKPVWFANEKDGWRVGQGSSPRAPEVRVRFANMQVANAVLRNQEDTIAAVGAQRIKVTGLVPLADALGLVMERLNFYL